MSLGWVKIDEKLPEKDGSYLVFIPTLDEKKPFVGIAWFDPSGFGWSLLPKSFIESITHWMAFPKWPEEYIRSLDNAKSNGA